MMRTREIATNARERATLYSEVPYAAIRFADIGTGRDAGLPTHRVYSTGSMPPSPIL
jgi:hypothetical protein